MSAAAWSRSEFESRLRAKDLAYHIHHPFNMMLNSGLARPEQIRGWVANRFYYQINIPRKDAAIIANCDDRMVLGATGCSAFSITMATAMIRAESSRGCAWARRWKLSSARGSRA